jgi:hypothetical protein
VTPDPLLELVRVLESARAGWTAASAAAPVTEAVRVVAGEPVRFRVAGTALVEHLLPAFGHLPELPELAEATTEPAFTIHAWDASSTGVSVPTLPPIDGPDTPASSIIDHDRAASSSSCGRAMLDAVDFTTGDGWFAVGAADDLSHGERGAPFRLLLHWWLARRGVQVAHGGAVGARGTGVLLVGAGGAGKSSTTLSCVESGLDYAGDDYCAITAVPRPTVHSLYCTAKVFDADVARYPSLAAGMTDHRHPADDKSLYRLDRAVPDQLVAQMGLAAIVVPVRTDASTTRFTRASAGTALQALAPSTVGQLPGHAARTLATLAAVARALPAYRLELGCDRATVAPAVRELIELVAPVPEGARR